MDSTPDRWRFRLQSPHGLPVLGAEREPNHFPFGSLLRADARLAAGSDWPVTSADPLMGAYTSGAAHSMHLDHMVGTIAPDMLADLIVVDHDLRDVDGLAKARVERVYIDGELVHQA